MIDLRPEVKRIHIVVEIEDDLCVRLEAVQADIFILEKRLHRPALVIEHEIPGSGADGVVPPERGIGREEEIVVCLRVSCDLSSQKSKIAAQLLVLRVFGLFRKQRL